MQSRLLSAAVLAAALFAAPAAFATVAGSDFDPADFSSRLHYEKTMSVPLRSGAINVYSVKLRDKRMVFVPVEEFESILRRAEGHSMSLGQ
jgi:hypothetical protein